MFTKTQLKQLQQLLEPLKGGINDLKIEQQGLKIEQQKQNKTLKSVKSMLNKTAKTVDIALKMFDKDVTCNTRRIKQLEEIAV